MTALKDKPAIEFLDGAFAIHRFEAGAALPDVAGLTAPWALVRTAEGVTLVCYAESPIAPKRGRKPALTADARSPASETESGWTAFRIEGPLDFALTGVLAGISAVLAGAGISIFAFSCWETDYVLVRRARREDARRALTAAGYPISGG